MYIIIIIIIIIIITLYNSWKKHPIYLVERDINHGTLNNLYSRV